jgi:hypothetical protein
MSAPVGAGRQRPTPGAGNVGSESGATRGSRHGRMGDWEWRRYARGSGARRYARGATGSWEGAGERERRLKREREDGG